MKIAVVGCGAMGSVYAGLLAGAGHEVLGLTRFEAHVDAINTRGLRVQGPAGDRTVRMRAAVRAPAEAMDLVILSVKAADVESGARDALPMLAEHTTVLTIQNGLGSEEVAAGIVGADRLAVGIAAGFGASLKAPGHAHHNAMQAVRLGPYAGLAFETAQAVAEVWRQAGFDAQAVHDIAVMQWEKLICNTAYSAPCALTGMTVGELMDHPDMGPVSQAAAREAWDVARALGVALTVQDPVVHARAFGARVAQAKPSALLDHEAGRVSEVDCINGAVVRQGERAGIPTPVNRTLVSLVRAKEQAWRT